MKFPSKPSLIPNFYQNIFPLIIIVFSMVMMTFFIKLPSLASTNDIVTKMSGSPFESSNTNSRYVLTEAIVERGSFFFTVNQAQFAAPDAVFHDGKFFSIFTPGISFAAVPFYAIGEWLGGYQHLTTFFATIIFALINLVLIFLISRKLGASYLASWIGGLVFLFGTNALGYAFTLTQHHGSVTVILFAILNALAKERTWLNNLMFGVLCGVGLLFDFPNVFLLFVIGLFILAKHIHTKELKTKINVSINPSFLVIAAGFAPLIGLFMWYHTVLIGSPFSVAQMFPRTDYFDTPEQQELNRQMAERVDPYAEVLPFSSRAQIRGFYTLILSDERAWFFYSPVILLGILGIWRLYQQRTNESILLLSVLLLNVLMYGMFGDPWGGWSFGPRYLIPGAAILSIFLSLAISRWKGNVFFALTFLGSLIFSVGVNVAGALTTLALPPKIEAEYLGTIPHTYVHNFRLIEENQTFAAFYNLFFNQLLTLKNYWLLLTIFILAVIGLLYLGQFSSRLQKWSSHE